MENSSDGSLVTNSDSSSKLLTSKRNPFSIDRLLCPVKGSDCNSRKRFVKESSFADECLMLLNNQVDSTGSIFPDKRCLVNGLISKQVSPIPPSIYVPEGLFGRNSKKKTEKRANDSKARKQMCCVDQAISEKSSSDLFSTGEVRCYIQYIYITPAEFLFLLYCNRGSFFSIKSPNSNSLGIYVEIFYRVPQKIIISVQSKKKSWTRFLGEKGKEVESN